MYSLLSPYWLWALLALPAVMFSYEALTSSDPKVFGNLRHPTGEFSARFLIIAMLATPLGLVFRGWRGPRWLKKNRRYFGVAAFGYGLLHTLLYLLERASLDKILNDLPKIYIWSGWLAFLIFIPLALTSSDYFLRKMGPGWKTLQRMTYFAAALTLLHWASLESWKHPEAALIHFGPLIALECYRLWYWYLRPRPQQA